MQGKFFRALRYENGTPPAAQSRANAERDKTLIRIPLRAKPLQKPIAPR